MGMMSRYTVSVWNVTLITVIAIATHKKVPTKIMSGFTIPVAWLEAVVRALAE
jgi:hypothetical protein